MQARLINQAGQQRTFVVVLDTGDEVMASLKRLVTQESLEAAQFTAIGAFRFRRINSSRCCMYCRSWKISGGFAP